MIHKLSGFLPEELPLLAGWEIAACFEPARQVAGDFYDPFPLPGGRVGLVVADVCDKGVGAALYMALFRSLIRALATQPASTPRDSAEILNNTIGFTNEYIARTHGRADMFATVFFAILDPQAGILHYLNGGHEPPLILRSGAVRVRLTPTGPAVGMVSDMSFGIERAEIDPGETLFAYTDGLTEARGADGFYGEARLHALLRQHSGSSAATLLDHLARAVAQHTGTLERFDDLTLLAAQDRLILMPITRRASSRFH